MRKRRILSLLLLTVLLATSLVGCKNNGNTEVDVAEQVDYDGLVTAEQNYFDMSNTELETIIKAIADYKVCSVVKMKLLNNESLYDSKIVEELYNDKKLQEIEAFCDCPEDINCEHRIEAEEFNKNLTPVRDFDQTQMETWYGGPVALSEMTLNIVTYNVFPVSEKEMLVAVKYYDTDKQMKNIIGKYNNELKLITEIK